MLLEFSVSNFKSILHKQTLSMVAGKSAKSANISAETGNSLAPYALRSACILGANGAGKTSIITAIEFFSEFVKNSAKQMSEGDLINITPFKLSVEHKDTPSEFEARFMAGDSFYQYGFVLNQNQVLEEWLFTRSNEANSRLKTLFHRVYVPEEEEYQWDIRESLKGERETWKKATRNNALFLSTAVQLNSDGLRVPYLAIQEKLIVIESPERISHGFTAKCCEDTELKNRILNLIQSADLKISDLVPEEKDVQIPSAVLEMMNDKGLKKITEDSKGKKYYDLKTSHRDDQGNEVLFDYEEESGGTQVMLALAGPWIDVLDNGYTLFIDELHNSLHPLALQHLVKLFHDPSVNKKNAQLIFTTHDTNLLTDFMHRDQIWFVEKLSDQSSHLYPLSDFKVRAGDTFGRAYLAGKFGGLPNIKGTILGK